MAWGPFSKRTKVYLAVRAAGEAGANLAELCCALAVEGIDKHFISNRLTELHRKGFIARDKLWGAAYFVTETCQTPPMRCGELPALKARPSPRHRPELAKRAALIVEALGEVGSVQIGLMLGCQPLQVEVALSSQEFDDRMQRRMHFDGVRRQVLYRSMWHVAGGDLA